jgi:hypothetical protein
MKKKAIDAMQQALPEIFAGPDDQKEIRITPQADRTALAALMEILEEPISKEEAAAMAAYLNNPRRTWRL